MNCNCVVATHLFRKYNHIEYQKVLEAYFFNAHNLTYNTCTWKYIKRDSDSLIELTNWLEITFKENILSLKYG